MLELKRTTTPRKSSEVGTIAQNLKVREGRQRAQLDDYPARPTPGLNRHDREGSRRRLQLYQPGRYLPQRGP